MSIHIKRRHGLGQDAAKQRMNQLADGLKKKLAAEFHWSGDSLLFSRKGANGQIHVTEQDIDIQVKLGMMLRPLEDGIRKKIEEELKQSLA